MRAGEISFSLEPLQRLAATFADHVPAASARRAVVLARELGDTAVPLLARKLRTGSDREASWAYYLLAQVGGPRAIAAVRALVDAPGLRDERRSLALGLLAELGAELPDDLALTDPEGFKAGAVDDLVARLSEPADVARAADLLVEQVGAEQLGGFLGELASVGGAGLAPIVDELLLRDDLAADTLAALRALRGGLPGVAPLPAPRGRQTVWIGRRVDGARVVVGTRVAREGEALRRRAAVFRLDAIGQLAATEHHADLPAKGGLRALAGRLRADGFHLRRVRPRDGAAAVAAAAVATRLRGGRLPRGFYLGRDLLGLTREHADATAHVLDLSREPGRRATGPRSLELLDQASELLERGEAGEAARVAERHVLRHPDDAEARSLLGSCYLALGRPADALPHLSLAARLEPDEPLHHWNHSHAAKAEGKMGACYLALERYLAAGDVSAGADERAQVAREFMRLFERFARLEHPDATVPQVARCEELFDRGYAHMAAERYGEARACFEAVLKLVGSHYQSWSNLGVVLMALGEREAAERCLRRALEVRPDYDVAKKNLALLQA